MVCSQPVVAILFRFNHSLIRPINIAGREIRRDDLLSVVFTFREREWCDHQSDLLRVKIIHKRKMKKEVVDLHVRRVNPT